VIPPALWALATIDAAFCGYRAAAGRNALIRKHAYYLAAMGRGALAGQAAVAIAGAALVAACAVDGSSSWNDLLRIGGRMISVYVPYASLILAALALRAIPSVDLRSLTSTLVFGPLTLARPVVVTFGLAFGLAAAPTPARLAVGLLVAVMMLGMEPLLGRRHRRPAGAPAATAAAR
jgi:hypothetical protein